MTPPFKFLSPLSGVGHYRAELKKLCNLCTSVPSYYGHFVISSALDEEVVLVSGGTGITPFTPFLQK